MFVFVSCKCIALLFVRTIVVCEWSNCMPGFCHCHTQTEFQRSRITSCCCWWWWRCGFRWCWAKFTRAASSAVKLSLWAAAASHRSSRWAEPLGICMGQPVDLLGRVTSPLPNFVPPHFYRNMWISGKSKLSSSLSETMAPFCTVTLLYFYGELRLPPYSLTVVLPLHPTWGLLSPDSWLDPLWKNWSQNAE